MTKSKSESPVKTIDSPEELGDFCNGYYLHQQKNREEQLSEALEYAANMASTGAFPDLHSKNLSIYFFGRAAIQSPLVIPIFVRSSRWLIE